MRSIMLSTSRRFKAVAALGLLSALGAYTATSSRAQQDTNDAPASKEQLRYAFALSDAFQQVHRSVSPSVVNIRSAVTIPNAPSGQFGPGPDDFFRRFFDLPEGSPLQPDNQPSPRQRIGE